MASAAFEWDEAKSSFNLEKHGVDFETAKFIFSGPRLEKIDTRRDYKEQRIVCIGAVDDFELVVVYTWRSNVRRLISARRAHDRERQTYRQAFPELDRP